VTGDPATDVPIACTLGPDDLPARLAEWQAFGAASVRSIERAASSARIRLDPSDGALLAAASLAQRETECCAFFEFAVLLEARDRWLTVRVPAGAEDTLSGFLDLLEGPFRE
jgi:hypothetical protein